MGAVDRRQRQVRPEHRGNPLRLEKLRQAKLTQCLRLVHFHIGSQVPNIITIKNAVIEATRFYCQLAKMGFPMGYLDVGGGLGIDYDGSRTNFEIVDELLARGVCARRRLQHPRNLPGRRRPRTRHRQRKRPGRRRPALDARRRGVRADQQARVARPAAPAQGQAQGRHRPGGAAQEQGPARPPGVLPRRHPEEGGGHLALQPRLPRHREPGGRRGDLLADLRADRQARARRRATSPRSCTTSRSTSPTSTSAISRSFSRCSIIGRSNSCSPSPRCIASTRSPRSTPSWSTSRATRTARSAASSTCRTSRTTSRCTR